MEELTDYETKHNGWIDRKSNFNVPNYGNACIFSRRTFRFVSNDKEVGKIMGIVCKVNERDKLFFKYYNPDKHRVPPTDPQSESWLYASCEEFMSKKRNSIIQWVGPKIANGATLIGRRVKRRFSVNDKFRWYSGTICSYDKPHYKVDYIDGDKDELTEAQMLKMLKP